MPSPTTAAAIASTSSTLTKPHQRQQQQSLSSFLRRLVSKYGTKRMVVVAILILFVMVSSYQKGGGGGFMMMSSSSSSCRTFNNGKTTTKRGSSSKTVKPSYKSAANYECVPPTNNNHDNNNNIYLYQRQPQKVIEIFDNCVGNDKCHVLYQHVQKTGGSYLASKLKPTLEKVPGGQNNNNRYVPNEWCCGSNLIKRFQNNTSQFCTNYKFSIYEMNSLEFSTILETCSKYNEQEEGGHTYVSIVTVREPIQRTISQIHQQCNKGYKVHAEYYQKYCQQCMFLEDDSKNNKFWIEEFVHKTNKVFVELQQLLEQRQTQTRQTQQAQQQTQYSMKDIPILILDSTMINDFLNTLDDRWTKLRQQQQEQQQQGRFIPRPIPNDEDIDQSNTNKNKKKKKNIVMINKEETNICNFGITSTMMRELAPSLCLYNNHMWVV